MRLPRAEAAALSSRDSLRATKIDGLQMLRALAVLLVTWLHSHQNSRLMYNQPQPANFWADNLGMFGVDIFFSISGFILTMVALRPSSKNAVHRASNFFVRRLIRIYPIYWILLLLPILRYLHQHVLPLRTTVLSVFLLPGWQVPIHAPLLDYAWTLMFEMFFYCVISLLLLFGPRSAPRNTILTLCLLVLSGLFTGINHPLLILIANPMLLEFVAGASLAIAYSRWIGGAAEKAFHTVGRTALCLGWLFLLGGIAYIAGLMLTLPANSSIQISALSGMNLWQRVATWGVAGWLLTAGTVLLSTGFAARRDGRQPFRSWAWLAVFLGDASYSIYLSSAFTMEQFGRIMERMHVPADPSTLLIQATTLLSIVLVVLFGVLFHVVVERPLTTSLQHRLHSRPYSTARLP